MCAASYLIPVRAICIWLSSRPAKSLSPFAIGTTAAPRKLTLGGGLTLKAARKLASDALYELEQGRDPAHTKQETRAKIKAAKANTVRALCDNYLHREAGKLRSGHLRKQTLESASLSGDWRRAAE